MSLTSGIIWSCLGGIGVEGGNAPYRGLENIAPKLLHWFGRQLNGSNAYLSLTTKWCHNYTKKILTYHLKSVAVLSVQWASQSYRHFSTSFRLTSRLWGCVVKLRFVCVFKMPFFILPRSWRSRRTRRPRRSRWQG